jgi:ubiquinone/menaquinone biosynthesis C-methylase UbiE
VYSVRTLAKRLTPRFIIRGIRDAQSSFQRIKLPRTRTIFENAGTYPAYLVSEDLELLQRKYPPLPEYGYDPSSTERRGFRRAGEILGLPAARSAKTYLELGCWDGMVSCFLQRHGKRATAIDIRSDGFDDRARREGVRFLEMNAENLQFPDESFDCVFSYDTFEHFPQPGLVLANALRVLRPGGRLFLNFGPLYLSPFGQHAYRTITVPYCQLLFARSTLNDFAVSNGLNVIEFNHVNGWRLAEYRKLWESQSSSLKTEQYVESLNLAHLDLIRSYPACFRSKTDRFKDLIVETVTAVFEKVS